MTYDTNIDDWTEELIKKQFMEWSEFEVYVRSHVYLQYYVNKASEKLLAKNTDIHSRNDFTTSLKLQVLHGMKFLSNVMYDNCVIINQIRNKFAHTLNPNDQSIHALIRNMKVPWYADIKQVNEKRPIDVYRMVSIQTIIELKNALTQNRNAMFFPDETEYDKENKKYI